MKLTFSHKILSITLISILALQFSLLDATNVFSQQTRGNEYQCVRSNSVPAGKIPLAGQGGSEYHIGPGDKLSVFVWQNPDLTGEVIVTPDGKICYPLVGVIDAEGLTIYQLQAKLKEKFSEFVKYAQVTVTVKDYAGNKVVVLGEVVYPGVYTFTGSAINVMEAIGLAGDFEITAKRESVIIVSDNLAERPIVRRVNVFMALRRGTMDPNMIVKGGDVVFVPKRFISDFNQFMNDLQPTMSALSNFYGVGALTKAWWWHRDVNSKPADGN